MTHETPPPPRAYGQTDTGRVRSTNDDSVYVNEAARVYAVADGLGGLPEGALASQIAIQVVAEASAGATGDTVAWAAVFDEANRQVCAEGYRVNEEMGIGTTLTVVRLEPDALDIGHIGDSGVFVFTVDSCQQVTQDHTMAQEMLDRLCPGEHAYIPEYFEHTLTRCIGQGAATQTDVFRVPLSGGERVLLYTDGVTKTHTAEQLHAMAWAAADPRELVEQIIRQANERGGPDNVTAVAIFL
jgi:protein phosphatase